MFIYKWLRNINVEKIFLTRWFCKASSFLMSVHRQVTREDQLQKFMVRLLRREQCHHPNGGRNESDYGP